MSQVALLAFKTFIDRGEKTLLEMPLKRLCVLASKTSKKTGPHPFSWVSRRLKSFQIHKSYYRSSSITDDS